MKTQIFLLLLIIVFVSEGNALPRFSLRGGGGFDCSGCHVNPTGGDMRTSRAGGDSAKMSSDKNHR